MPLPLPWKRAPRIRRPLGFVLGALALGPVWALGLVLASALAELLGQRFFLLGLFHRTFLFLLVPALTLDALVTAWLLRGRIAAARGPEAWRVAGQGLALGAPLGVGCLFLTAAVAGLSESSFEDASGGLLALLLLPFMGPILGWLVVLLTLPVSFPLAWLSVRLLHLASGGPVPSRSASGVSAPEPLGIRS